MKGSLLPPLAALLLAWPAAAIAQTESALPPPSEPERPEAPEVPGQEAVKPEAVKPEAVKPEAVKPEAVKPEAVKPETVKPETVKPEVPPPAPPPVRPPAALLSAVARAVPPPAPEPDAGPLGGFSDHTPFLRSPGGAFVLFPGGLLQLDGAFFRNDDRRTPHDGFLVRRARLEATGWIGPWTYFSIAGDFAAAPPSTTPAPAVQSNLQTTDDYVAFAPFGTLLTLQVGQYDAPFTLENRTSDKYLDFLERSITVRAFGIPENKQIGAMLTGYNEARSFHYAAGVFNGDGQNVRNLDHRFDGMVRAWIAPFSFSRLDSLRDVEVGGSLWRGDRQNTQPLPAQTTAGGFPFLTFGPYDATIGGASVPVQLRQVGLMRAYAGEIDVPVSHRAGVRAELVWKHSNLSEDNVSDPAAPTILGGAYLEGWSVYGEAWFWLLGDDRIVGDSRGLEPFTRLRRLDVTPIRDGLMLAARFERLDERLSLEPDAQSRRLGDPAVGRTQVTSYGIAVSYWHSKRFRAAVSYFFNRFEGTTAQVQSLLEPAERELLFRLALSL